MKKIITSNIFLILFFFSFVYAEPQKLEDIRLKKKQWQIDTILVYNALSYLDYKNRDINENIFTYVFTLRYDLTDKFEVFGYGSYSSNKRRIFEDHKEKFQSSNFFNSTGIGISYNIHKESKYPGLLFSLLTNAYEKIGFDKDSEILNFKTYSLFLTSYYTVDPIVIFAQFNYKSSVKGSIGDNDFEKEPILSFTPQVYFLINPFVSLNFGFRITHEGATKVDGKVATPETNYLSLILGFSYELVQHLIFSIDTEYKNTNIDTKSTIISRLTFKF
jgi:hypothetical protein